MTAPDTVHDHQARCAPHLARLWMLAGGPGGAPLRSCAVHQIIEATSAILAEVRAGGSGLIPAADRDAPGSVPPPREAPDSVPRPRDAAGNLPLLAARLTRLENAAGQMIDSARSGNSVALREQIARFDVLTSAMWTIQLSECATPGPRRWSHRWAER